MTRLRAPVVAGVSGGVGTSTVAAALHGRDGGRCPEPGFGPAADLLVCRYTEESLCRAAELADGYPTTRPLPVLAVTALTAVPPQGLLHSRLRAVEALFSSAVVLPRVMRWREVAEPILEAAGLLAEPVETLPRELRAYAEALRVLAAAVAASGRLDRPPVLQRRVRGVTLWRGLHPVERGAAPRVGTTPSGSDPDDDALEAALVLPAAVAG